MTVLTFNCPHCGNGFEDPYEVLDDNRVLEVRCDECRREFAAATMECHRCGREETFVWPTVPSADALPMLTCSCSTTFLAPIDRDEGA